MTRLFCTYLLIKCNIFCFQKKTQKGKSYSIADVEKAVADVKKGTSINAAGKAFNVPYATLYSRVKEKYPLNAKPGPSSILIPAEEKELVDWIFDMHKRGFPVIKNQLLDTVQMIVVKTGRNTPFTNGRPGKNWYQAFLKRHPELSERMCQNLTKARASVTEGSLRRWFQYTEEYLASKNITNIEPERVFNMDESGFLLNPKNGKVIVPKGEKSVYSVCGSEKECYTAIIAGNAAGQLLPTMVVYSYERIPPLIANLFPDDFVIGKSESGWMTSELFYSYFANHVYPWCVKNKVKFPIVFYVDGHSSHLSKALSDFCCEHEIELIALFPNATHILQPMDVALFHTLKTTYRNSVRTWRMNHDGRNLGKESFAGVLKSSLDSLDIKQIFKNGFKKCGLWPFCVNSIDYKKVMTYHKGNEQSNEVSTQQIQTNNTISSDSATVQNVLNLIESKIDPIMLEDFKQSNSEEWAGDNEFKGLYNFWMDFTKSDMKSDGIMDKSNSNDEFMDIDDGAIVNECMESDTIPITDNTIVIDEISLDEEGYAKLLSQSSSDELTSSILIVEEIPFEYIHSKESSSDNPVCKSTSQHEQISLVVDADVSGADSCEISLSHNETSNSTSTSGSESKKVVYLVKKLLKNIKIKKVNRKGISFTVNK